MYLSSNCFQIFGEKPVVLQAYLSLVPNKVWQNFDLQLKNSSRMQAGLNYILLPVSHWKVTAC